MSASDKKKLRREQNKDKVAKQMQASQKEAARLKLYTIIFAAALALMVVVFVCTSIFSTGVLEKNTTAVTVAGHKLNGVTLNYYYIDSVSDFIESYGSYLALFGLDPYTALDKQYSGSETKITWADDFIDQALQTIKATYCLYDKAVAAEHKLTEDEEKKVTSQLANLTLAALQNGYSNVDSYLVDVYGRGSSQESYEEYLRVQALASSYYTAHSEEMKASFTKDDIKKEQDKDYHLYSNYKYSYYYVAPSAYYEGGKKDDKGNTVYSDEEKAAGLKKAEEVANRLLVYARVGIADLDRAIKDLPINAGKKDAGSTHTSVLKSSLGSVMKDWLIDKDRKVGDATVLTNSTTSKDENGKETTTVNGYYVIVFEGIEENTMKLVNVRHILVAFTGGTTDSYGNVTYSDTEKETARKKAADLLAKFKDSKGTEFNFGELAEKNSDDTGSKANGGLIENIYPNQMVESFNDWIFAEGRKVGDTDVIESEYGYHVMFFNGFSDTTFREYMIKNTLLSDGMDKWYEEINKDVVAELITDRFVEKGLILAG
jgi:hypothetical protein